MSDKFDVMADEWTRDNFPALLEMANGDTARLQSLLRKVAQEQREADEKLCTNAYLKAKLEVDESSWGNYQDMAIRIKSAISRSRHER